jgi:hypothetical protein
MSEESTSQNSPSSDGAPQPSRPAPPPFRPNKELIGYIEKGQKPPVRPERPTEKR